MAENIVFKVDDKIESKNNNATYLDAGIHENIELVDLSMAVSPTGKDYITITFTSEDGNKLVKTEWKPTISGDQGHDILISKCENQSLRFRHIMKVFMEESQTELDYNYNNWADYVRLVKVKLDPVIGTTKVRIKAVFDNKGYVSLPNYRPFIESMAIPAADSKIKIGSGDRMIRPTGDKEVRVSDPFKTTTGNEMPAPTAVKNDLPF